jgi:ferric-dicitrate binding protein FerR (iron transport regulator)
VIRRSTVLAPKPRVKDSAHRAALGRQFEEAEFEARHAFEQYNAVDARHRFVAAELERRWDAALEEVERLRATLSELEKAVPALSTHEQAAVFALGGDFAAVWESTACPPELKKKILRTVLEEIIVTHDEASDTLPFGMH